MPHGWRGGLARRLLRLLVVVVVLGWLAAAWVLPTVARRVLVSRLGAAGVIDPWVRLDHAGLWGARGSVYSGDGRLRIPSISVTYSPFEIVTGRVRAVEIDGAEFHLQWKEGSLQLAGLRPTAAGGVASPRLPIGPVPLESLSFSATLVIEAMGHEYRLPVTGTLIRGEDGMHAEVRSDSPIGRLSLTGDVPLHGQHAEGSATFVDPVGWFEINAGLSYGPNGTDLRLFANSGARLPLFGVEIEKFRSTWGVGFDQHSRLTSLGGSIAADRVALGGWEIIGPIWSANLDTTRAGPSLDAFALDTQASAVVGEAAGQGAASRPWTSVDAKGRLSHGIDKGIHAVSYSFDVRASKPVAAGGVTVTVPAIRLNGELRIDPHAAANPVTLTGVLAVERASVGHASSGVVLGDITARLPFAFGRTATEAGEFKIGSVGGAGVAITGSGGSLRMDDDGISASFHGRLGEGPTLNGSARVRLAGFVPTGEVSVQMPEWTVGDPELLGRAIPALKGWEIDGQYSAEARLAFDGPRIVSSASLHARDASFRHPANDLELGGVNFNVALDSLWPLSSAPEQKMTVRSLRVGKLEAAGVAVSARVESLNSLFIEKAQWSMGAKGRFQAYAIRFDPAHPRVETELYVQNLMLQDWTRLLAGDRISAQGVLSGHLPVIYDPQSKEHVLRLGEGFLHSEPGTGRIIVHERKLVEDVVNQGGVAVAPVPGVDMQKALVDALSDFEYGSLAFDLVPEEGDMTLRITTTGRGKSGNPPISFQCITINIPHFGPLLSYAWREYRGASETIDRSLNRVMSPTPPQETKP